MRKIAAACLCIGMCASASGAAAADAEERALIHSLACLVGKARLADDHVSSAAKIAKIIRDQCAPEEALAVQSMSDAHGLTDDQRARFAEVMVRKRQSQALIAVSLYRRVTRMTKKAP